MVGVRGPVYLAAGVVRMSFLRFIICDLVCATLVVGTFFSLSYFYGKDIYEFIRDAEKTLYLARLARAGWHRLSVVEPSTPEAAGRRMTHEATRRLA